MPARAGRDRPAGSGLGAPGSMKDKPTHLPLAVAFAEYQALFEGDWKPKT